MKFKRALRVWQRHFTVYTKLYKSSIALNFVEPVLYLAALGLGLGAFVKEINGMPYINFIAPGIIASSSMFATIYECTYGTYVRMTYQKTFDAILATPVNIDDLVAGELMWGAFKSMFYGTTIIVVIALFGFINSPVIILAIPVLFVTGLIFAEISVIFIAVVPGIDSFNLFLYSAYDADVPILRYILPAGQSPGCSFTNSFLHPAVSSCEHLQVIFTGRYVDGSMRYPLDICCCHSACALSVQTYAEADHKMRLFRFYPVRRAKVF